VGVVFTCCFLLVPQFSSSCLCYCCWHAQLCIPVCADAPASAVALLSMVVGCVQSPSSCVCAASACVVCMASGSAFWRDRSLHALPLHPPCVACCHARLHCWCFVILMWAMQIGRPSTMSPSFAACVACMHAQVYQQAVVCINSRSGLMALQLCWPSLLLRRAFALCFEAVTVWHSLAVAPQEAVPA
jgi:hypothetical protein